MSEPILLLGGTEDAYQLAERLNGAGLKTITSLAGRTAKPRRPQGRLRIGGFSAEGGLEAYLKRHKIKLIVDATHPYAAQISAKARAAAQSAGIVCLSLERPLWQPGKGDIWQSAENESAAAAALARGARAFLALGRQHLAPFAARADCRFFARMIEAPQINLPPNIAVILGRPQSLAEEKNLFSKLKITCLVCRNSGSAKAFAKLAAARARKLPVTLISRPKTADKGQALYFSSANSIVNFLLKSKYCHHL